MGADFDGLLILSAGKGFRFLCVQDLPSDGSYRLFL